jgi:cell division protein YceG involved in septum cleavage
MLKTIGLILIILFSFASCIYVVAKDTPVHKTSTVIQFTIQAGDTARVAVYNLLGNFIAEKSFHEAGSHRISIDIFNLPAGVYFVRIRTSRRSILKKVYVIP